MNGLGWACIANSVAILIIAYQVFWRAPSKPRTKPKLEMDFFDDGSDSVPVQGFTRSGYVILRDGEFAFDAGDINQAHAFMQKLRDNEKGDTNGNRTRG